MKSLIDNIITFLQSAITAGDVSANTVKKGFENLEDRVPIVSFPYIAVDDGGERVEEAGTNTQNRIYSVIIEMGAFTGDIETSLDAILDLSDEVKAEFEKEANRQYDGHVWGVSIEPFVVETEDNKFFRGRRVTIDFWRLEDREYIPY